MNQPQYDSPDAEGAARLAQMAAMGATVIEALARLQAHRTAQRADNDERATASWRALRPPPAGSNAQPPGNEPVGQLSPARSRCGGSPPPTPVPPPTPRTQPPTCSR